MYYQIRTLMTNKHMVRLPDPKTITLTYVQSFRDTLTDVHCRQVHVALWKGIFCKSSVYAFNYSYDAAKHFHAKPERLSPRADQHVCFSSFN